MGLRWRNEKAGGKTDLLRSFSSLFNVTGSAKGSFTEPFQTKNLRIGSGDTDLLYGLLWTDLKQ